MLVLTPSVPAVTDSYASNVVAELEGQDRPILTTGPLTTFSSCLAQKSMLTFLLAP